jgi:hydroxymethylbilane synthase
VRTWKIGTRASALALAQANEVAAALTAATGRDVELVKITTKGDVSTAPLASIGGMGVFVSAVRDALLDRTVDLAVHSLKDLPTAPADGLMLAAIPRRGDARDALCARDGHTLGELPAGSTVGTGAPRRVAQLRALDLGLDVVPVRGNVDSRLAKVRDGELDAVVLAMAGLSRLGLLGAVTETLDPLQMLPAPGQGALAVECRDDSSELAAVLANLDDSDTRAAVTCERTLLSELEAGCTAPVGALAEVAEAAEMAGGEDSSELYVRAVVASDDGMEHIRKSATGPVGRAAEIGRDLARELIDDGAGAIVGAQRGAPKEEKVS